MNSSDWKFTFFIYDTTNYGYTLDVSILQMSLYSICYFAENEYSDIFSIIYVDTAHLLKIPWIYNN